MEKENLRISKPEKEPDKNTIERPNGKIEVVYSQPASQTALNHVEFRHKDGTPLTGLKVEDIYYKTPEWTLSLHSPEIGLDKDIELIETDYFPDFAEYNPESKQLIFTRLTAIMAETAKGPEAKIANFLSADGSIYILLHEIGHSKNPELVSLSKKLADIERKRPEDITSEEQEAYLELVMNEERRAHAWALGKFRELRKKQMDVEPNIKSFKTLSKFIHSALETYGTDEKPA